MAVKVTIPFDTLPRKKTARAKIKFRFKLGKTFTETFKMMKNLYGDNCLSRSLTTSFSNSNTDRRAGNTRPQKKVIAQSY